MARRSGQALRRCSGQALLELAVMGSFIILLLGAVVSYGLNADYNQQALMEAHRRALSAASNPDTTGGASVVVVQDRAIPSPTDPFGIGTTFPFSVSASVTKDPLLGNTADRVRELPRVRFAVNGQSVDCPSAGGGCTTAGFRREAPPDPDKIDRYFEVYGRSNVCNFADCGGAKDNLKIIDACEGEIITLDTCVRQARMIVNATACQTECERGRAFSEEQDECQTICEQPITIPAYAEGFTCDAQGRCTFPNLTQMAGGFRSFGLQTDLTRRTILDNRLTKTEDAQGLTTTEVVQRTERISRELVHRPLQRTGAESLTQPVADRERDAPGAKKWETPWN